MATKPALYSIEQHVAPSPARERLPFVLPDFTRRSWVSELARSVWEPRIVRILRAWRDIEWLSVDAGVRESALIWISPAVLSELTPRWEVARLSAMRLRTAEVPPGARGLICILVGELRRIEQLRQAWDASDDETVGTLLGYPSCCRVFFRDVWVKQRCLDTTWAMAENTPLSRVGAALRIELPELPEAAPQLANILWRWLGVRAVPHLPCRFDCSPSVAFAGKLLEVGRKAGYAQEVEWLTEILTWPVEWSALHGIAEVKSPLLKVSTRTDATAGKCVVQWAGTRYPEEGAVGLHFPFQPPTQPKLTASPGHLRGLAHATAVPATKPMPGAEAKSMPAPAVKRTPRIDTSANTIRTPDRDVEILMVCKSPRIVLLANVLSDEECDELVGYCESKMVRSSVVSADGGSKVTPGRTGFDVSLKRGENALVVRIERRLAALAEWPVERSEGLQVVRYDVGQEYRPHFDWLNPELPGQRKYLEPGGQRLATFVLYLSNVESGGGTSFPALGLDVLPRKGGAVFFLNTDSDQQPDRQTLHAGTPVVRGVKFIASTWLRQRER